MKPNNSVTPPTAKVNGLLQAALKYAAGGIEVFPIKHGQKAPPLTMNGLKDATTDPEKINHWWSMWPKSNIGIRCTDLLVADFDGKVGAKSLEQLEAKFGKLSSTLIIRTGGGTKAVPKDPGLHYIYRVTKDLNIRPGAGKYGYPGFDIRANDSYIVAAPSVTRLPYKTIDDSPIADAPQWLIDLAKGGGNGDKPKAKITSDSPIPDGQRNDRLTRIAGAMRRQGADQVAIEAALLNIKCETPLPDAEIKAIAASVCRYEPSPGGTAAGGFNLTDSGNAKRLAYQCAGLARYSPERNLWYHWNGKLWECDIGGIKIARLAKKTNQAIYLEAGNEDNDERRKDVAKHATATESQTRLEKMIISAQSEPDIAIMLAEFDCNQWLLNCGNGTIDLRTGTIKKHDATDLITKIVPIDFAPDAECPKWGKFLDDTTDGDNDLKDYLQLIAGVILTGDMLDQIFFYLFGLGQNGKSTFTDILLAITGDYGMRVDSEMFMLADKGKGNATEAVANIRGKRLLISSEVPEGRHLNTGLLKDLTGGGELIRARRLYEHEIEFKPVCKIVLFGNHKPAIRESTLALWRRLKLIEFNHTVDDKDRDQFLSEKLTEELQGILAWAIRGCLIWQSTRFLNEPEAVTRATKAYRDDEDLLADFLADMCGLGSELSIDQAAIKKAYLKWCEDNGIKQPMGPKKFGERLIEKNCRKTGIKNVRSWTGVTLK